MESLRILAVSDFGGMMDYPLASDEVAFMMDVLYAQYIYEGRVSRSPPAIEPARLSKPGKR